MIDKLTLVQFETTTACPARCLMCPHKNMVRPHGRMSWGLITKIIDESLNYGVKELMPFLNGEPFADERLFNILQYIKDGIAKRQLNTKVGIYTNIHLATKEKLTEMVERFGDIIGYFEISFNGVTAEKYMEIMGLPNFEENLERARWFCQYAKDKFPIVVGMVGFEKSEGDYPDFEKMFGSNARLYKYFNWGGKIGNKDLRTKPCHRILQHMTILCNGKVALCCMDNEGDVLLGDANTESIKDIWESFQPVRDAHKVGKYLDICSVCNME